MVGLLALDDGVVLLFFTLDQQISRNAVKAFR